ncbi:MAG TPA: carboxypeptidase-like regulatory domain-containing protein, partial [Dysgonamonadaceae bacterium]|nr:carboxypeptidase-like regulatory domain-containing protein [Dysgonamonadaceae bacterium]
MGYANEATQTNDSVVTLRGRVLGADTNQPLVYASVTVKNSNISSVTNQDGYFSIRVPLSAKNSQLIIRHLSYANKAIPIITLIDNPNNHILMSPSSIPLKEIEIVSGDGAPLIKEALQKIPVNY